MKNKIKYFIVLIMIVMPLLCGITVFAESNEINDIEIISKSNVKEASSALDVPKNDLIAEEDVILEDLDDIQDETPFKKGSSNILLKFFISIVWVVVSSLIIYFALISYKKVTKKTEFGIDIDENSLDAPKNFKEAINLFIKKTRD